MLPVHYKKILISFLSLLLVILLWACDRKSDTGTAADEFPFEPPSNETPDPFQQNLLLARGVNLGNALEAPNEGDWGVTLQPEYFQLIKDAGFTAVRIPIRWSAHAGTTSPYAISASFFDRVDWAVGQAIQRSLAVVINIHHYDELFQQPGQHKARFLALWKQIAGHYQNYPDELFFELLNEPHDNLTAELWNQYLAEAIPIIRQTNPYRTLIIGPAMWNNISLLPKLVLPESDRNIIVTFHYYNPFHFTHQGAEWVSGSDAWLGTTWTGTASQQQAVTQELDEAAAWAQAEHRPLFMGEFGAYSKADLNSRYFWTRFVAREAERRNISWAYWEFCAGFGIYDPVNLRFGGFV